MNTSFFYVSSLGAIVSSVWRSEQGPRSGLLSGVGASRLKKFVEPHSGEKKFFSLSWGSESMLPQKILKIKYLGLAKNAFPKISQLIFLVFQKR